jgi:squalene synthase HpnD
MTAALDTIPAPADEAALRATIRARVEAAGTSFYWAMRLLPEERRNGMYAVYAFCREVDDIADDDAVPAADKKAALADWHDEIEALYAGEPRLLVARALREPVARYGLRREDFHAVIDGMEMDAITAIRAPDLATLDLYCGRVAGAVGHLSVHVFGDASDSAHAVADALDEDAQRGRVYLPRELLDRHDIAEHDPQTVLRHPALPAAARDLAAIAEGHFADAARHMARCSRRAMRPAAVMAAIYRANLAALLRAGWRDPAARVGVAKPHKLWLALRHGLL